MSSSAQATPQLDELGTMGLADAYTKQVCAQFEFKLIQLS